MKKTFKDRLRIIGKNFYIVILLMLLSGIAVFYYANNKSKYYIVKSVILIEDNEQINLETYVEYLTTKNIIKNVKNDLNLDIKVDKLINNISIKNIENTKLIEIKIKDYGMNSAIDISNKLIEIFKEEIYKIYPELDIYIVENPSLEDHEEIDLNIYLTFALTISFILGCLIASIFGLDNISIKNHEDLKKYLNIKSLGIIPDSNNIEIDKKKIKNGISSSSIKIINDSASIISESYRMVRTNLDFLDLKIINFTSTSVGEGKSETISNVATSFAMIGKKVLLIDCDLRKPKIHKNFNLNRALGITDILVYNRVDEYKKIVQKFKIQNSEYEIDILSAGSKVSNPSELLCSKRFENLIKKVSEDYDLVLIDCPPISLMTDAVIVSKVSSGTAYVIEYDRINYSAISNCIEQLTDVNANILGGIITKVNINKQKKLYGNKYEYYYNNYMS